MCINTVFNSAGIKSTWLRNIFIFFVSHWSCFFYVSVICCAAGMWPSCQRTGNHAEFCTIPGSLPDCSRSCRTAHRLSSASSSSWRTRSDRIWGGRNPRTSRSEWTSGWLCEREWRSSSSDLGAPEECPESASSSRLSVSCRNCDPNRWKPETNKDMERRRKRSMIVA